MKIALCLTGQLRKAKFCFPYIKKAILDPYKPTVFMVTEKEKNFIGSLGPGENDADVTEIIDLYNPIKVRYIHPSERSVFIQPVIDGFVNLHDSTNVERFSNDLYKKYICAKDLDWINEKYDVVIRARFDLQINEVLPLKQEFGINIPSGQDWINGINDQLAWGDQENMLWYMNLFSFAVQYNKDGVLGHPETMLRHHLNVRNITVNRIPLNYVIVR